MHQLREEFDRRISKMHEQVTAERKLVASKTKALEVKVKDLVEENENLRKHYEALAIDMIGRTENSKVNKKRDTTENVNE